MDVAALIREKGIKATAQRIAVYNAISELGHCSAEEVATKVRCDYPSITIATVYCILDSFDHCGLIARLSTPSGKIHYDVTAHPHHHIYHSDGMITDYEDKELAEYLNRYFAGKKINNQDIKGVKLQLFL